MVSFVLIIVPAKRKSRVLELKQCVEQMRLEEGDCGGQGLRVGAGQLP